MREVNAVITNLNPGGLDVALKAALGAKSFGLSAYGAARPISIWLDDTTTGADDTTAQSVVSAHDPVNLSGDKTQIAANGTDAATITVSAPKQGAAPVTLLVSVNGAAPTTWPITLTGGVGTDTITSLDPCIITISVQNPANRTTDTLKIQAI